MNRNFALLLITMSLLLQVVAACGQDTDESGVSNFTDKQRGWYWYEVQPEPVLKRKPEPPLPKPTPPSLPATVAAQPKPMSPAEPEPLTSAWLRKNMEAYLNKAIRPQS